MYFIVYWNEWEIRGYKEFDNLEDAQHYFINCEHAVLIKGEKLKDKQ